MTFFVCCLNLNKTVSALWSINNFERAKKILRLAKEKLCIEINFSSFVVCTISRLFTWLCYKYFDQSSNHAHSVENVRKFKRIKLENVDWSPLITNKKVTGHIVKKVHNLTSLGVLDSCKFHYSVIWSFWKFLKYLA